VQNNLTVGKYENKVKIKENWKETGNEGAWRSG
jgi:hypothetical protein